MKYLLPLLLLLVSCGVPREHDKYDPNIPPVAGCNRPNATPAKATLVLFGAPPCSNCHATFPKIGELLEAANAPELKVRLYVETGPGWTDGPTFSITHVYASAIHLCADEFLSDTTDSHHHPSYKNYTEFTGTDISDASLPAAVILDKAGTVVERYAAGTTFVPESIVARALQEARK